MSIQLPKFRKRCSHSQVVILQPCSQALSPLSVFVIGRNDKWRQRRESLGTRLIILDFFDRNICSSYVRVLGDHHSFVDSSNETT